VRQSHLYEAIKYCNEEYDDPVELCCDILRVSRSAYYKWLKGDFGKRVLENERIADSALMRRPFLLAGKRYICRPVIPGRDFCKERPVSTPFLQLFYRKL